MTTEVLGRLVEQADPAMLVVTASAGPERAGCLVGFHSQCSIDPLRYAVWISTANHTYSVARRATHLGLHFLGSEDRALAELFGSVTGDEFDKFARGDGRDGPHGVPLLEHCENWIVVRRVEVIDDGGDHVCFVTEPIDAPGGAAIAERLPLRYSDVAGITPGHPA